MTMKKSWFLKIFNGAAIALILASVFVLLSVVLTPAGQVPQVMGFSVFRVLTGSMEPEIPEGSLLLVKRTDTDRIQIGDVISFFSPDPTLEGAVNTHRVVDIQTENGEKIFCTKGDANVLEDTYPVRADMVVGKALHVSTGWGKAVAVLSNPLVFGSVILLPLLGILLWNLWHAVKIARDLARQEEEAAIRQALEEIRAISKGNSE